MSTPLPRRILVPVDFERGSRRAVRYARALAGAAGADIWLLHVVPMPQGHAPAVSDTSWITLAEKTLARVARERPAPEQRTA